MLCVDSKMVKIIKWTATRFVVDLPLILGDSLHLLAGSCDQILVSHDHSPSK